MKRFTLFTLLYLAAGVCLTAIAFQHFDTTSSVKTNLLIDAGLLYLFAVLTAFPFWRQSAQRSRAKLRDKPAWLQNFVVIAPWLILVLALVSTIFNVINHSWGIETIAGAFLGLPVILVCIEWLSVMNPIRQ